MTKFYLAATYPWQQQIVGYRKELEAIGHSVTSQWLDQTEEGAAPKDMNVSPSDFTRFALKDINDIREAEALIFFSASNGSVGTGGRHTELGIALALGKAVYLVGPIENVFHTLPVIGRFPTWDDCLAWIATWL